MKTCSMAFVANGALVALLVFLSILSSPCNAAPLATVQYLNNLWEDVALGAAAETVEHIRKKTGLDVVVQEVPMDTFQVCRANQFDVNARN